MENMSLVEMLSALLVAALTAVAAYVSGEPSSADYGASSSNNQPVVVESSFGESSLSQDAGEAVVTGAGVPGAGGVGIAAYAGKFIRHNKDVDIFVKKTDFQQTKSVLDEVCELNDYRLIPHIPEKGRPKLDIKINDKERFSVIPAYIKNGTVKFIFGKVTDSYSFQILERVERHIDGYKFYTPPDGYIKKFFLNHLAARRDKIKRPKIRIDIEAVFTPEERSQYNLD